MESQLAQDLGAQAGDVSGDRSRDGGLQHSGVVLAGELCSEQKNAEPQGLRSGEVSAVP